MFAAPRRLIPDSAVLVRAPPYIKVERENCPPDAIRRYSHRCIGRARHKLKRARQLRHIYPASAFALSTLGERRLSTRGGMRCCRGIPYSAFRISNSAFPLPFSTKKGGASPSRLFWLSGLLLIVLFILGAQFYRGLVPAGLFQTVEVAVQLAPDMVRAVFAHYRPHGIHVGIALLHLIFLPFKD